MVAGNGPIIEGYSDPRLVGRGGFSTVYRARQDRLGRDVAIKVLHVDLSHPQARDQFLSECVAAGRMANHPNIVTVYDSGVTAAGEPYLVMEYCEQGSLADWLRRDTLDAARALSILVKLCGALATAHRAGILHRDLKPENVLFTDYGEPALADFGIAALTSGAQRSFTVAALTPHHAAPEVLDGGAPSVSSDVYSLASTAYQILTGRPPFQRGRDEGLASYFGRVVRDAAPPVARPGDPDGLTEVIARGLAKTPAQRYATAEAFGQELRRLQRTAGVAETPMVVGTSVVDLAPTGLSPGLSAAANGFGAPLVAEDDSATVDLPQSQPTPPPTRTAEPAGARKGRLAPVLAGLAVLLLCGGGGYVGYRQFSDEGPATRQVADGRPVATPTDTVGTGAAPATGDTPTPAATSDAPSTTAEAPPGSAPAAPPQAGPTRKPPSPPRGGPATSPRGPQPYVEYLRVVKQPTCPSGAGVPNPFPGNPAVIEWKVAGGATGSVLSVDGAGRYGEYGVTGTETLSFPCGDRSPGERASHRYTVTTSGGGPQKSRSITVTARVN
ncbi:serine/threonine-protein kinase [Micromonospora krabiensis]|uniref:non-specific serine/threonine protein kinase n=1 Tax=Micromonospora krabiensis TaxID=307121 RepID=A0A1C3MZP8_9ACTN|nr:serine/threonine-protein kinase [Micromonospora krabiensis]SBV25791.1 Serine/threonine protein kinase [Micromonospora krabiensis]